jgi:hypothetical protein
MAIKITYEIVIMKNETDIYWLKCSYFKMESIKIISKK